VLKNKIKKLLLIFQTYDYFMAFVRFGISAGIENINVLNYLLFNDFQTVVDVGSNRGQFALVARRYFPKAKIVSFEPLKEPAVLFRRLFATDSRVFLHEIAIGPDEKEMTIHVSRKDDSSSLLPITDLQNSLFQGTSEREIHTVQVKPLARVLSPEDIKSPALLKMDVQGYEKEALEGCRALMPLFSHIYVECSFVELYAGQSFAHEVISFLSEFGFVLCGVYNLCYDKKGMTIQGDFLFNKNI